MWNTGESLEGLKASWRVIPHVPDNRSLLPLCSDARWGYPQVCVKAGVYRQQGNCLSAPPLGDLSLLLRYDFISNCYDHLMPLYDPYVVPIFYASFIYQDSSIKGCVFLLCCADCAMIPLFFVMDFPTTNDPFVLSSLHSHTPLVIFSTVFLEG